MTKNIGTKDRVMRLILGIISIGGIYFSNYIFLDIVLIAFALFCFFQATFSWCVLYHLLGKNTCPIQK